MSTIPSVSILAMVSVLASSANFASAQFATQAVNSPAAWASLDSPSISSSTAVFPGLAAPAYVQSPNFYSPAETGHSMLPLSGIGIAAKLGASGIGFDVAVPILPTLLNLRGGASFFSYTLNNFSANSLNLNGKLNLHNSAIMADVFPFRGRFRVSGGLSVYNDTSVNGNFSVAGGNSFTVGGTTYYSDPTSPITGTALYKLGNNVGPRFTIGTGNLLPNRGRWTFESEVGFQYVGQPTVSYTFSGRGCTNYVGIVYSNCGSIAPSDINQEQINLQNDVSAARFFPIVSVGVGYRIH